MAELLHLLIRRRRKQGIGEDRLPWLGREGVVVSTVEYLVPTYILGEAVGMPRWDGGRRGAYTQNPVNYLELYRGGV